MNNTQRAAFSKLYYQAKELGHIVAYRVAPNLMSGRCTCGWSCAESRFQNALARTAKLNRKVREHYEQIVKAAQERNHTC